MNAAEKRIKQLEGALLEALITIDQSNGEVEEDSRNPHLWQAFHGVPSVKIESPGWRPGSLTAAENGAIVLTDADDIEICPPIMQTVTTAGGSHDRRPDHHTAALFAAAPDLLDALQGVAARWNLYDEDDDPELGAQIRDALKRATTPEHSSRY